MGLNKESKPPVQERNYRGFIRKLNPSRRNETPQRKKLEDIIDVDLNGSKVLTNMVSRIATGATLFLGEIGYHYFIPSNSASTDFGEKYTFTLLLGGFVFDASQFFLAYLKSRKIEKNHSIIDKELGYRADKHIYHGNDIPLGKDTLSPENTFYKLNLPTLKTPDKTGTLTENQRMTRDRYNSYILRQAYESIQSKDVKAVLVNRPKGYLASLGFPAESLFSIGLPQLFAGDERKVFDNPLVYTLITKDVLEKFTANPHELFKAGVRKLQEELPSKKKEEDMLQLMNAISRTTGEEQQNKKQELRKRLETVFNEQAERKGFSGISSEFDHIEVSPSPNPDAPGKASKTMTRRSSYTPKRRKQHGQWYLYEMQYGLPHRKVKINLNRPIDQIVASKLPIDIKYKALLLSHALLQMLDEHPLDLLTKEPVQDKAALLKQLKEQELSIDKSELVRKEIVKYKPTVRRIVTPILSTILLVTPVEAFSIAYEQLLDNNNFKLYNHLRKLDFPVIYHPPIPLGNWKIMVQKSIQMHIQTAIISFLLLIR